MGWTIGKSSCDSWVSSGLTSAPGILQSPVEGFHRIVEPELRKSLHGWELKRLSPERSLFPDDACYKKIFKASPRTCSEYSLRSVPISVLVVLSLIAVELDHRICGGDYRCVRRFQLANPACDK